LVFSGPIQHRLIELRQDPDGGIGHRRGKGQDRPQGMGKADPDRIDLMFDRRL